MIVITGASSGIGLELAKLYKEAGIKVVNISHHQSEHADVNIVLDLNEDQAVEQAAQQVLEIVEPVQAVVNCVGVYNEQKFGEINGDEIKKVISINVKAPMLLVSLLIERIKKDGADVLNIISKAGVQGNKDNPVYASSKWAERGFTLSLQEELKNTPCRVISFCPGGINTKLFEKAGANIDTSNWMSPKAIALFIKQILELPKNMEVSEVIINRKSAK